MTDALLYDAFIQCLRLPLEVFKKICKCLGGVFVFVFLIIRAILLYFTLFSVMSVLLEFTLNVQLG